MPQDAKAPVSYDLQRAALGLADTILRAYQAHRDADARGPTDDELLRAIKHYQWALASEGSTDKWFP